MRARPCMQLEAVARHLHDDPNHDQITKMHQIGEKRVILSSYSLYFAVGLLYLLVVPAPPTKTTIDPHEKKYQVHVNE